MTRASAVKLSLCRFLPPLNAFRTVPAFGWPVRIQPVMPTSDVEENDIHPDVVAGIKVEMGGVVLIPSSSIGKLL